MRAKTGRQGMRLEGPRKRRREGAEVEVETGREEDHLVPGLMTSMKNLLAAVRGRFLKNTMCGKKSRKKREEEPVMRIDLEILTEKIADTALEKITEKILE